MNKYSCIIIEDEPLALERTKSYVDKVQFLSCVGVFDNSLDALKYLHNQEVDVLFLDINMDELSGIELLESTKINSQIIITSAFQEYALKGYELNVTDYLLKPFTFDRFLQAVNKLSKRLGNNSARTDIEYVFIKTENRLEKIMIDEVLYIEGMRDYRRFHTKTKKIMTLQTFSELESMMPGNKVCRVHKSYMVAINKIDSIERSRIKVGGALIPVSNTYKETFFRLIDHKS